MPWTFYLANDFQFYLLGVPIIWLYRKSPKFGLAIIFAIMALSFGIQVFICLNFDITQNVFQLGFWDPSALGDESRYVTLKIVFLHTILLLLRVKRVKNRNLFNN